jgi:hypothetical protein
VSGRFAKACYNHRLRIGYWSRQFAQRSTFDREWRSLALTSIVNPNRAFLFGDCMINIETDSHGRTYEIWKQDQMNSCGVASAWMARGIVRQMSVAEEEWTMAQRLYRNAINNALAPLGVSADGPMSLDPRAFPSDQSSMASTIANFGFYAAQLARALRAERMHVEHVSNNGNPLSIVPYKIAINKPAIALVYWNGGGGHFVVAGRCTSGAVSFLDPWDGHVNERSNNGRYTARYGSQGIIGEVLYLHA